MKKLYSHLIIIIALINILTGCALALDLFSGVGGDESSNQATVDEKPELLFLTAGSPSTIHDLFITQTEITISWKEARDPEVPQAELNYVVYYCHETEAPEVKSPKDLLELEKGAMVHVKGNPTSTEIGGLTPDTSYRIFVLADNTKKDYVLYNPATLKTEENQDSFKFEDSETSLNLAPDSNEIEAYYAMTTPESTPLLYQNFTITADIRFNSPPDNEAMIGIIARAEETSDNHYKGYLFKFSPSGMGIGSYRNNDNTYKPLATKKFSILSKNTKTYSIKASLKGNHLSFGIKTSGEDEYSKVLETIDETFQTKGQLVLYSKNAGATISNVNIYSSDATTE